MSSREKDDGGSDRVILDVPVIGQSPQVVWSPEGVPMVQIGATSYRLVPLYGPSGAAAAPHFTVTSSAPYSGGYWGGEAMQRAPVHTLPQFPVAPGFVGGGLGMQGGGRQKDEGSVGPSPPVWTMAAHALGFGSGSAVPLVVQPPLVYVHPPDGTTQSATVVSAPIVSPAMAMSAAAIHDIRPSIPLPQAEPLPYASFAHGRSGADYGLFSSLTLADSVSSMHDLRPGGGPAQGSARAVSGVVLPLRSSAGEQVASSMGMRIPGATKGMGAPGHFSHVTSNRPPLSLPPEILPAFSGAPVTFSGAPPAAGSVNTSFLASSLSSRSNRNSASVGSTGLTTESVGSGPTAENTASDDATNFNGSESPAAPPGGAAVVVPSSSAPYSLAGGSTLGNTPFDMLLRATEPDQNNFGHNSSSSSSRPKRASASYSLSSAAAAPESYSSPSTKRKARSSAASSSSDPYQPLATLEDITPGMLICPACGRTCSSTTNLRAHFRRIHDGQRFRCSRCSQSFSTAKGLQDHVEVDHLNKVFLCPKCPQLFRRRRSRLRHASKAHGLRGADLAAAFRESARPREGVPADIAAEHNERDFGAV